MKTIHHFLLLVFCLFPNQFTRAKAAVLPETARLMPPQTIVLLNIDNFSQTRAAFEKTDFYKLYKDPAMAGFVEDFKKKWRTKMQKLGNKIAEGIVSADMLPQGRLAVALVIDEQTENIDEPRFLLIAQWGSAIGRIKEAVDETVKAAIESGLHKTSEDYRGITIVTMIKELPPRKVPDFGSYNPESRGPLPMKTVQPPPEKTHYCYVEDCLIVSDGIDALKFVLAHFKGAASPALAADADYSVSTKAVGPHHDIDLYVNIKQFIRATVAADTTGQAKAGIANLGLDNVASLAVSIAFAREPGTSCAGKAILKINGAKKGICRMLETESATLRAPRFISASACSTAFFNLNLVKAYEELGNILRSFSPEAAAWMYAPLPTADSPDEPGLKIKEDFIDHLASQIVIAQNIIKPASGDATPMELIFALAVNDRKSLEKSLSLMHAKLIAPNNPEARREVLGHTLYLLKVPGFRGLHPGLAPMQAPSAPKAPQMLPVAFAVTDTHLIFGTEPAVERAIRASVSNTTATLDSAKWFNTAKAAVPSTVGLASFQDNAASSELSWKMIKQSTTGQNTASSSSTADLAMSTSLNLIFSEMGLDLFDFGLLPDFDAVRKHFGLSAGYGVSRADGFFFEFKYLSASRSR
jgi:hypothetical protein